MDNTTPRPVLTMFAGINGSGKSTLYTLQQTKYHADMGIRICPDEILVENDGNWEDYKDVYASGRIAVNKINECIAKRQSFNWEFTLLSDYVLKVMHRAKEADYQIRLNFILVEDVEVSLKRIEDRVRKGGHGIPEDIVRSRFARQLINMEEALHLTDISVFFDNSDYLKVVGLYTRERPLEFIGKDTPLTRELLARTNTPYISQYRKSRLYK